VQAREILPSVCVRGFRIIENDTSALSGQAGCAVVGQVGSDMASPLAEWIGREKMGLRII